MESIKKHTILNAIPDDYHSISKFFYDCKTLYFGHHRKKDTQEKLFFRDNVMYRLVIPLNPSKHIIIGYAEVSNVANMPALADDLWLDFINFHYCCNLPLSPTNTCILRKFVYHPDYNPQMLKQLLEQIFHRDNKLKHILVMESPNYRLYERKDVRNYSCLQGISLVLYPKCFSIITNPNTPKLHIIMRDKILPDIRYRKALPEDNDDIVGIAHHDNPHLKKLWGEYYIAEELLAETESLLIVAEINNLTAGFIWLNDKVDLLSLLETLNLQSFGNLLKLNANENFKEQVLLVNSAKKRPLEDLFTATAVQQIFSCACEINSSESASNLSLCSCKLENSDSCVVQNLKKLTGEKQNENISTSVRMRFEELNEKMKSSSYYVQLQQRPLSLFYNIPDGQGNNPWYAGANAFKIELLGLINTHDPRLVFHLLLTAFAAFPEKDYCLLTIPVGKPPTAVILELLKLFIPVNFRPNCSVDEHYFITNRSAVLGDISIHAVRPQDTDDIINVLKQCEGGPYKVAKRDGSSTDFTFGNRSTLKTIFSYDSVSSKEFTSYSCESRPINDILENIFNDPLSDYKCYTIRCGDATRSIDDNKVVGFVIIRPFLLSKFLRKHFHTVKKNELHYFFEAEIVCLKLHSFFHFQADFIFRELSRQTNFNYFYYLQATDRYSSPNDLAAKMQPLEPRRIKKLWFDNWLKSSKLSKSLRDTTSVEEKNKLKQMLDLVKGHYAVFTTNLRPTAYFGSVRNIVILGFTDICKAFLRLMIFSWHHLSNDTRATVNCLPQLNITVICSPGVMEADYEYSFECETCLEKSQETCWVNFKNADAFVRNVCDRLDVTTWIKFASGKIKSIDGFMSALYPNLHCLYRNQHLITMQSECEISYETLLLMCGTEFGVPHKIFKHTLRPPNYCHINSRFDKILVYHKLQLLQNYLPKSKEKSIIVYGCHVRAFEFVNFLLQHGIKGSEIHLLLPCSNRILQLGLMLNNSAEDVRIEEILLEMAGDLGVQIYEGINLSEFKLCENEINLEEVTFEKILDKEQISLKCDLFVSFYEVFLPGPLLDIFKTANIETDQDSVLVNENYQTSLNDVYAMGNFIKHKTESNHQYRFVSPQEAAEKIINALQLIKNDTLNEKKFSKSSYFQAQLPMDFLFVKITTPKRFLANHLNNEYGFPLVTYNNEEFSRVRLNDRGMVEEIVVVTKKRKNYDFLKFFCGQHELMLNNLKSRWYLKDIVNFIDFFQESWTELIMHDEFESLKLINKNLVLKTAQQIVKKDMDREDRIKLFYGHCQDLGLTAEVEYAFLNFIRNNRGDFFTEIALPEDFADDSENNYHL